MPLHAPTIPISSKSSESDSIWRTYSAYSQMQQAIAGAGSGFFTRFLTQPFDVLKIRFQLQVEPLGDTFKHQSASCNKYDQLKSKYTTMLQAIRVIYKEEGLQAFWRGHNAGQYMTVIYTIIQFWSYEQIHLELSGLNVFKHHYKTMDFLSGALAGTIGITVATPLDVIRTRIVAQDPGSGYKNVFQGFHLILRHEGIRGLFRGYGATVVQIGPLVGGNFMFYNYFNYNARKFFQPDNNQLPTWSLLVTGGMAGVCSKTITYPLDFIKKRLQIRGFENHRTTYGQTQICHSTADCVRMTMRDEGILGFYKGLWPTLIKSGLTTAFYFGFYDAFKRLMSENQHNG